MTGSTVPKSTALELEDFLPYRLSVTEWRVMAVLGRYAGISAREVATRTAMDKVAVSRAVARMLESGRIERDVANHDKRQSELRLTASGRAIYSQVAPLALQHETRLLAQLDEAERKSLTCILDKLWRIESSVLAG